MVLSNIAYSVITRFCVVLLFVCIRVYFGSGTLRMFGVGLFRSLFEARTHCIYFKLLTVIDAAVG